MDLAPGALLVAEPALLDPNFRRSLVLLCEHNDEGSFGLILNRPTDYHLPEVLADPVSLDVPLFFGGPVQTDTLHFLHTYDDEVEESIPVAEGVSWGGPFDEIVERVRRGDLDESAFRFFVGYSGWGPGQLEAEVEEGGWIVLRGSARDVFEGLDVEAQDARWRTAMRALGGEYALLSTYPDDPQMN